MGGFGPVAGVSLVAAVLPGDADQPTDGTLAISPKGANAGSSQTFTLTFTATVRLVGGTVILQVPAGWPPPQALPVGTEGYTTSTCVGCTLTTDPTAMTITITGLTLAPPGTTTPSSLAVMYPATVPGSAASDTFTAMVQQTRSSALLSSGSAPVAVAPVTSTPVTTRATTPATTPVTTPATTPVTTQASTSPSSSQPTNSPDGSRGPILLVLGLVAGLALVLLAGWFVRPRPVRVRAVPHAGPPAQLSVHATGTDATHTVRIEPHPGAATTTTEERGP